jgi:hypothetical protein
MRASAFKLAAVLLLVLGAMAAKSLLVEVPHLRLHSTPGEFDSTRAKARLAFLLGNERPHPSDTLADDQVRARLVAQLQQIGLTPIVRDQFACNELFKQRGVSCARVRNVIAILGPPTGKALLLNAHYDSVPVGPGASDDGIGVATLLEVAANLKDKPLKRPVILLFNEGEELGLVGARAFLADPLSRNVDALINLEARGVRGPVNMFETSLPNAAPIAVYAAVVRNPVANSLSTDVYRLMPNYTDVNSFSERNWLTLNLAPIGNETRYHSAGDEISALDPATLQHMGDQTLALALALANGTPRAAGGDRIFMDISGRALISLPLIVGASLLVALLIAFGATGTRRRGLGRAAAVVLGSLAGSAALAWLALAAIGAARHGMFWRAEPVWTHLATYASTILAATFFLASVGRALEVRQLRGGFWLIFLVIGALIGLAAPGGIIFFLFPPLIVLMGMIAVRSWRPAEAAASAAAILVLYLTWGAMLGLLEELLNDGPMWLFAPLGALLILPALIEAKPLIDRAQLRAAAAISAMAALVGWAAAAAAPAYSADRQQRFLIEHVTNAVTGKAYWSIVNDRSPPPAAYGRIAHWRWTALPYLDGDRWVADAAPAQGVKPPSIELGPNVIADGNRAASFRIHANGAAWIVLVGTADSRIAAAGTRDFLRPIDRSAKGKYYLECSGRSCDGAMMEFVTPVKDRIGFTLIGGRESLPAQAAPLLGARPEFARPQYRPDETLTVSRVWL